MGVYSLFMLSFSSCDCEVVWKTKIEDLCNNLALKFCANTPGGGGTDLERGYGDVRP